MIQELLSEGAKNRTPGRELAEALGVDIRKVTQQIERERRAGAPICANSNGGYFLAADDKELADYCEQVKHRAIELFKTRQALIKILKQRAAELEPTNESEQPNRSTDETK